MGMAKLKIRAEVLDKFCAEWKGAEKDILLNHGSHSLTVVEST